MTLRDDAIKQGMTEQQWATFLARYGENGTEPTCYPTLAHRFYVEVERLRAENNILYEWAPGQAHRAIEALDNE
jgi:hypothetical protein